MVFPIWIPTKEDLEDSEPKLSDFPLESRLEAANINTFLMKEDHREKITDLFNRLDKLDMTSLPPERQEFLKGKAMNFINRGNEGLRKTVNMSRMLHIYVNDLKRRTRDGY